MCIRDRLQTNNSVLQVEAIASTSKIESLQSAISTLEEKVAAVNSAILMKDSEIATKTRALQEKDTTISGMYQQLTRARECLATKQQVNCLSILQVPKLYNYFNQDFIDIVSEDTHLIVLLPGLSDYRSYKLTSHGTGVQTYL